MALDSYSNLKTAISEWLDMGTELDSYLDDYIGLAQAQIDKDVRMQETLRRANISVSARYINLPNRMLDAITFRLMTDPITILQPIDIERMNRERIETTDRPTYFTIHSQIEMDCVPDQNYTGEMIYYESVLPLSTGNPTNVILEKAPGAYLYGALVSAAPMIQHDERIQVWRTMYEDAVDNANMIGVNKRIVGTPISRIVGATP